MSNKVDKAVVLLDTLLAGATIKAFEWANYFRIMFILRVCPELPPEAELLICNNWWFDDIREWKKKCDQDIGPVSSLDESDALRGFYLAGITDKSVERVAFESGCIVVRFEQKISMYIPLKNTNDEEEDSWIFKVPDWVNDSHQWYAECNGQGEVFVADLHMNYSHNKILK